MFIDIEPESKVSLQIGQDDIDSDSTRYQYLAKTYFDMLDLAIDMLGKTKFRILYGAARHNATLSIS